MSRFAVALGALLFGAAAFAAQSPLTVAALDRIDRATLAAALDGDVVHLEPYLAPEFQASIEVPTEQGPQTLRLGRAEFLVYAWQARSAADGYRVRSRPARYRIAGDGRTATGTRVLDERVDWNGRPLRYTTERITHYRALHGGIGISRLEVRVIDWAAPETAR